MSASKEEEEVYMKQIRYLQDQIKRRKEFIQQKKENIKLNKAKCAAIEQETKDITEYLEYEIAKKKQRLVELKELYEQQKKASQQELQEIKEKNDQSVQKLEDELQEKKANLLKMKAHHAEILDDLQKQVQSRKDRLVQNQKDHDAKMKAIKEEELDPEMVARAMEEAERTVMEEFFSFIKTEHERHQQQSQKLKDKLAFLKGCVLERTKERDDLALKVAQDKQKLMEVEKDIEEATVKNRALTRKAQRMQDMKNDLEKEVRELRFSVEDHERNMKREQDRLSQRMAKMSITGQKQTKEIDQLNSEIEAERTRSTELVMALKEAHIIFKHIIGEPTMDLQKLKRLQTILKSYAPPRKTF